jgi:hypothetical protein
MMFGVMKTLARMQGIDIKGDVIERNKQEYDDGKTKIEDMLKSPMTLAQGAKIMNELRKKRDGDRLITEERNPSPFVPRLIKKEGKPYEG